MIPRYVVTGGLLSNRMWGLKLIQDFFEINKFFVHLRKWGLAIEQKTKTVCVYVSNDYLFQALNQDEIIEMIY